MRVCIGVGCWGWCGVLYHPALWAPLLPGGGELEMALLDMGDGLRRWFKEVVEREGLLIVKALPPPPHHLRIHPCHEVLSVR